jgi:hypothetical protein
MVLNSGNLNTSIGRNDNMFGMKRGKTLNSFLVFKYRFRSTMNTIFELY